MDQPFPFGVKYARVINAISIFILILAGVFLAAIAVPNFIKAAQNAGRSASPILLLVVGLVSCCIAWIPAYFLGLLNKALAQLKPAARIWQIVISLISLTAFPIGTIAYGIALYFMIFDTQTKGAFKKNFQ